MIKLLGKFLVVFVLILLVFKPLQAQMSSGANVNMGSARISQFSDQQIMQLWIQASANGMSESDAMSFLVKKGLRPSEVGQFKKRLVALQGAKKSSFSDMSMIKDTSSFMRDSTWVLEVPIIKKITNKYGYEFFANPNIKFEPNLRLATPKNYILGPDDELDVTLTGLNETTANCTVNTDGNIKIEYVGLINVSGLTMDEAKARILAKMSTAYPALKLNRTQLTITMTNYRSVRITIIGEAVWPGGYQISALSSVFNALYYSGGPTENGTLRDIKVIRNNKTIANIDLYEFLQNGKMAKDIRLEDQDVIMYSPYIKRVEFLHECCHL